MYYRLWSDEKEKGSAEGDGSWHDLLDDHEGMLEGEELKEALGDVSDFLEKYPSLEELLIDEHNCTTMDHCRPIKFRDPDPHEKYDMIAIGAGAGGLVTAIASSLTGGKAAIIERNLMGGDCLNTGCVPSKALLKAAKVAHTVAESEYYGTEVESHTVNFERAMEYVR